MENIMDSPLFRELQLVRLLSDRRENLERPKKLCLQLPVALGLDILAIQPNFLTGSVALRFDSLIVSLFLQFLGMVEIFLANNHQLSEFRR